MKTLFFGLLAVILAVMCVIHGTQFLGYALGWIIQKTIGLFRRKKKI